MPTTTTKNGREGGIVKIISDTNKKWQGAAPMQGKSKNKSQFSDGSSDGKLISRINACGRGLLRQEMEGCGRKRWKTEQCCLLAGCVGEMRVQDRMGTGRDEFS